MRRHRYELRLLQLRLWRLQGHLLKGNLEVLLLLLNGVAKRSGSRNRPKHGRSRRGPH